jgi:hypothetical protein
MRGPNKNADRYKWSKRRERRNIIVIEITLFRYLINIYNIYKLFRYWTWTGGHRFIDNVVTLRLRQAMPYTIGKAVASIN